MLNLSLHVCPLALFNVRTNQMKATTRAAPARDSTNRHGESDGDHPKKRKYSNLSKELLLSTEFQKQQGMNLQNA
jgi:hypothetical protein